MKRVRAIKLANAWNAATATDRVVLDAGDRQRRRAVLTGENGTTFLLDFDRPVTLRDGDGLVLDDGSIVLVAGQPEQLVEISTHNKSDLVRLAWHIGNRHTELQIVGDALRIRRDHVLEDMLRGQGAALTPRRCPVRSGSSRWKSRRWHVRRACFTLPPRSGGEGRRASRQRCAPGWGEWRRKDTPHPRPLPATRFARGRRGEASASASG